MSTVVESGILLHSGEAARLRAMSRTHTGAASSARRARIVLLAAQGQSTARIAELVGVSAPTVRLWLARYATDGVEGLVDNPRIGRPARIDPRQVLESTFGPGPTPRAGTGTGPTTRELAATLGISYATVARVWREHGLRARRTGGWDLLADPVIPVRRARVVGLVATRREAAIVLQVVDGSPRRPLGPPLPRVGSPTVDPAPGLRQVHTELRTLLARFASVDSSAPAPDLRAFQNQIRGLTPDRGAHVVGHRYDSRRPVHQPRTDVDPWVQGHSVATTAAWMRFCLGSLHLAAHGTRLGRETPWWPDLLRALQVVNGAQQEVGYFTWWRPSEQTARR